jgi:hypothetical protein
MIGVRFTKSMAPYSVGDTAMLPEDVAQGLVDAREAELYQFPDAPYASGPPAASSQKVMLPEAAPRRAQHSYRTKGR